MSRSHCPFTLLGSKGHLSKCLPPCWRKPTRTSSQSFCIDWHWQTLKAMMTLIHWRYRCYNALALWMRASCIECCPLCLSPTIKSYPSCLFIVTIGHESIYCDLFKFVWKRSWFWIIWLKLIILCIIFTEVQWRS